LDETLHLSASVSPFPGSADLLCSCRCAVLPLEKPQTSKKQEVWATQR